MKNWIKMLRSDDQPGAAQPPRLSAKVIEGSERTSGPQTDPDLVKMIRFDGTIYAHEFCRICGIKPNTLRMSRARGKGPPARRVSNNRVVISLRDAATWLQATGRYSSALRLHEWLERQWRDAAREHRRVVVSEVRLDMLNTD